MRIGRREVNLTNLDKIYFPEPGLTKGDLVAYYLDVADPVLNHVRRRPMQMKRYPDGVDGFFFYQKRVPVPHPDWLETVHIKFPSGRTADFPVCNDAASLAWIVNLGCIDLHTWHCRKVGLCSLSVGSIAQPLNARPGPACVQGKQAIAGAQPGAQRDARGVNCWRTTERPRRTSRIPRHVGRAECSGVSAARPSKRARGRWRHTHSPFPSMSVNRKVTVPVGNSRIAMQACVDRVEMPRAPARTRLVRPSPPPRTERLAIAAD